ncbi:MAG: hypothetical protein WA140_05030 [Geobacteraceae bacterium]
MKKTLLLAVLLVFVSTLSGCAGFDESTGRSQDYDRYGSGGGSQGGHSHH